MAESNRHERDVITRIRTEYQDLPGLRLTLPQAARLFDLDMASCAKVMETLVKDGALWTDGREFLGSHVGHHFG